MTTVPAQEPERRRPTIVGDPSLIGGRSWLVVVSYVVLAVAGAADLVTFHQVLELAVEESEQLLWTMVAGFTVVTIALSHLVGQYGKQAVRTRHVAGSWVSTGAALGAWLALGVTSFLFRWFYASSGDGASQVTVDGNAVADDQAVSQGHLTAFLFIALFIGTGVVSAIAGYAKHSSAVGQYLRARRKLAKAVDTQVKLAEALTAVDALAEIVEASSQRHEADWQAVAETSNQLSTRLKHEAGVREDMPRPTNPTPDSGKES